VSVMLAAPRSGILAYTPWGPRTIRPVRTSYLAPCQGHTRQPSLSVEPRPRSAPRWRHRRVTPKRLPSAFPIAWRPAPVGTRGEPRDGSGGRLAGHPFPPGVRLASAEREAHLGLQLEGRSRGGALLWRSNVGVRPERPGAPERGPAPR
jgi:hypothetical protein